MYKITLYGIHYVLVGILKNDSTTCRMKLNKESTFMKFAFSIVRSCAWPIPVRYYRDKRVQQYISEYAINFFKS